MRGPNHGGGLTSESLRPVQVCEVAAVCSSCVQQLCAAAVCVWVWACGPPIVVVYDP